MQIIKKKLLKSTVAKVMAAAMVVSMIPTIPISVTVSAEETASTDTTEGNNAQEKNEETPTPTSMPNEDSDINITGDMIIDKTWEVTKNTILNNNHNLTFTNNSRIEVKGCKLTINGTGTIKMDTTTKNRSFIKIEDANNKGGTVILNGGTIENKNSTNTGYGILSTGNSCAIINGGTINSDYAAFSGNGTMPKSNLYVLKGTLKAESGACIYKPSSGNVYIGKKAVESDIANANSDVKSIIEGMKEGDDKDITLSGGISIRMGTVKISSGTITSTNHTEAYNEVNPIIANSQINDNCTNENIQLSDALYVLGGTYPIHKEDGTTVDDTGNDLNLTIMENPTFNCTNNNGSAVALYDFGKTEQKISININGGIFKSENASTQNESESSNLDNRTAFDVFYSSTWKNNSETLNENLKKDEIKITGGSFSESSNSIIENLIDKNNYCCSTKDNMVTVNNHAIDRDVSYQAAIKDKRGNIAYKYCNNCEKWSYGTNTSKYEKNNHDYELYCISVPNKPAHTTVTFKNNKENGSTITETGSYGKLLNTETLTITPDDGYTFSKAPTVTPSENALITVTNPVLSNDGKSYTYTITANEGTLDKLDDVDLAITADATLANYNVSFDRSKLTVADADVYFINGTTKVTDNPYKVDKDVKELYIVIEPKAGKVFDTAPVITAVPASAIVNDVVIENGVYKYKVILGGDNADIKLTVGGAAKDAQYKITLPSNVSTSIPHASAELDFAEAAYNGSVKLTITPELGYTISNPSVKVADEKVCKLSEAVSEANGTFVYTISNITDNVAITSITATVAEPELVELKNTVQDNVNEASLSDTFANGNTKEEKAAQRQNYNYILSAAKEAISNITQDSDLITFDGDYSSEEKAALIKELKDAVENNASKIALSLEVKNTEPVNNEISETRREVENKISGNNATIGAKFYPLDISLFARVIKNDETQNNAKIKLTDTKQGKISIRMKKPNDIPNKSDSVTRKFYIVHFHKDANGTVRREIIDVTENEDGTLSFSSNAFSTYVLCYTDTIVNNNNSNTISGGGTPVVYPNGSTGGSGGGSGSQSTSTPTPSASTAPVASAAPSITPSVAPSAAPSTIPSAAPSTTPNTPSTPDTEPTAKPVSTVKVGQKVTDASVNYKVTSVSGSRTLTVTGAKSVKNVVIPASVKIAGKTYKVTAIANNAYKGNKNLTKITIGSNINKIGKNAFSGCTNLKKITIKTTKLTASKIGKNAFKGINKKAVIKVPKSKVKLYKKIIKARGAAKSVQVK